MIRQPRHVVLGVVFLVVGASLLRLASGMGRGSGGLDDPRLWLPVLGLLVPVTGVLLMSLPRIGVRFAVGSAIATTALVGYWGWWLVREGKRAADLGPLISLVGGLMVLMALVPLALAFLVPRFFPDGGPEHRLRDAGGFLAVVGMMAALAWWSEMRSRPRRDTLEDTQEWCLRGKLDFCRTWPNAFRLWQDLNWRGPGLPPGAVPREAWDRFDRVARDHCLEESLAWMCVEAASHAAERGSYDRADPLLDQACRAEDGWQWGAAAAGMAASFGRFDRAERWLLVACPEDLPGPDALDCVKAGKVAEQYGDLQHLARPIWERSCAERVRPNEACCRLGKIEEDAGLKEQATGHYRRFCPDGGWNNQARRECCLGLARLTRPATRAE